MFGIGTAEMVAIAVVAIIIFGPERCIKGFQQAGRLLRNLQFEWTKAKDGLDDLEAPSSKEKKTS